MPKPLIQLLIVLLLLTGTGLISGCIKIYRADVQQGNVITAEMLEKLKLGMTRRQVRFLLGTPLVSDPLHTERWDYYYSYKEGRGETIQRRLKLIFDDDVLVDIQGDDPVTPGHSQLSTPEGSFRSSAHPL